MEQVFTNLLTEWGPLGLVTWFLMNLVNKTITRHEQILSAQSKQIQELLVQFNNNIQAGRVHDRETLTAIANLDRRIDLVWSKLGNIEGFLEHKTGFTPRQPVETEIKK